MQCGPIRHTVAKSEGMPQLLKVIPKMLPALINLPQNAAVQDVFRHLATDEQRAELIAATITQAYKDGRKVLVLTERTEHLDLINQHLSDVVKCLFVLHGRIPKKLRTQIIQELNDLSLMRHEYCWQLASWLEKGLIIRRWTRWCWLCQFRGKERCNNMLADCIENMQPRLTFASMITLIQVILC
jgi:hypothetical protein